MEGSNRRGIFWCIEQTILKDGEPWDANMILDDGGDLTEMVHTGSLPCSIAFTVSPKRATTGVHRLYDMMKKGELKVPNQCE